MNQLLPRGGVSLWDKGEDGSADLAGKMAALWHEVNQSFVGIKKRQDSYRRCGTFTVAYKKGLRSLNIMQI
jgi:hypothetical protein